MAASSNIRSGPKGAVFVSYAPADEQQIFEIAGKITRCGLTVFLDEACYRAPRESHILNALSFADELLVFIGATRKLLPSEDSQKKGSIPAFLDRWFIWLAIGAAFARGIPVRGLLKGITRREVDQDPAIPAFIKGVTLFDTIESYEASLQAEGSKASLDTTRRPKTRCRVCLFCRPRTIPDLATIEKQLKGAGVETNLWRPDSNIDLFDAVVVVFHDRATNIWETPGLVRFLHACADGEKPVVLLTLPGKQVLPNPPSRLKPRLSYVEYRKSDNLCLLQLLWALVGYRLYPHLMDSGPLQQPSPLESSKISPSEKKLLIEIASTQAAVASVGVKQYFRNLVAATNWPEDFKRQRADVYSGDAMSDARELIDFAMAKGENPSIKGYTFLGSVLECLISDVGAVQARQLFEIIRQHALITNEEVINELRRKTQ